MAAVTRQPFAPLDGARIQNLTSLKNRQNAISPVSSGKRKAELLDTDDFENVDPLLFAKRSKGSASAKSSAKDFITPSTFLLTKATSTSTPASRNSLASPTKPLASSAPRRTLQPKSPAAKLNTDVSKSSPLTAPAGRSPTRGKRSGILNRRRTAGPYSRVEPPAFNVGSSAPFSLDAALKGTIPGYRSQPKRAAAKDTLSSLIEPDLKASWFFDIHEDTPEQEMTNLLQHGTCVLDISSDEESEQKATREKAEGRDKENIPPMDDVSQTSGRRAARFSEDEMAIEKERVALGEMNAADFFPEGCDETSVIVVPVEEEEQDHKERLRERAPIVDSFEFAPELKSAEPAPEPDVDVLMSKDNEGSSKAAVLQPIDGTGETFELWESGSAKDDTEAPEAAVVAQ